MCVVEDVVFIHSELCCSKIHIFFVNNKLYFKKLWNVDENSEHQSRKDEGKEVDEGRGSKLVLSVQKWPTYCQEPLCGYAHDQECFPGHHYVLQRVPDEREGIDINYVLLINDNISKNEEEEEDVTDGQGEKTLVEC